MKIAIVGSRTFPRLDLVAAFVDSLPATDEVVSGGARGVDLTAQQRAEWRGMAVNIFMPTFRAGKYTGPHVYFSRNQEIADYCDSLVAFTEKNDGGTWDTLRRANRAGKPTRLFRPTGYESVFVLNAAGTAFGREISIWPNAWIECPAGMAVKPPKMSMPTIEEEVLNFRFRQASPLPSTDLIGSFAIPIMEHVA